MPDALETTAAKYLREGMGDETYLELLDMQAREIGDVVARHNEVKARMIGRLRRGETIKDLMVREHYCSAGARFNMGEHFPRELV